MNINLSVKDLTVIDVKNIIKMKNENKEIKYFFTQDNDSAKNNFEVLYLLEIIDENVDYETLNSNLENEFAYASSATYVIDLLEQGVLSEVLYSYLNETNEFDLKELYRKNQFEINNLDEDDYLEYCFPYIIDNNINLEIGKKKCLEAKDEILFFAMLDDILLEKK